MIQGMFNNRGQLFFEIDILKRTAKAQRTQREEKRYIVLSLVNR